MKIQRYRFRMRRTVRLSAAVVAVTLMMFLSVAPIASAASSGANGLRVSPVRTDINANPGQTETVYITVTNITDAQSTFSAVFNDFVANPDESGDPSILLNPNEYAPSHSLKRFVQPIANFTLQPGGEMSVPVVINIPKNAAGGGYYGAVRFLPAVDTNGPNQTVSLASSVGSLILVKVSGNVIEQMSIASFDISTNNRPSSFFTHSNNLDAVIRLQNEGNVQEEPFGKILLKNRSGKILGEYDVNNVTPPGNVLPDSIRKFPISLGNKVGSFGEYKLEGNFGYGSGGQLLSASTTFYVIPLSVILIFIAIVIFLLFLIFVLPRLIRGYNARVLRRAGRALGRANRR